MRLRPAIPLVAFIVNSDLRFLICREPFGKAEGHAITALTARNADPKHRFLGGRFGLKPPAGILVCFL
jgi:hypothetical protein